MSKWTSVIEQALGGYGLDGSTVEMLQDFTNASNKLKTGSDRFFAKVHHDAQADIGLVLSEQFWLKHLSNFVICPAPYETVDGAYALEVDESADGDAAIVTVNRWIDGRALGQDGFVDLGVALAGPLGRNNFAERRDALFEGYSSQRMGAGAS